MPLASYVLLLTRQNARAFNQPLDLNTSSVTDISYMFGVRPARALPPISTVGSSPARCLRHRHPTPSRFSARMLPTLHALLSTRQQASAFNQPLSFDTSKVSSMTLMFLVRPTPALPPISGRAPPLHAAGMHCVACIAVARRPPAPRPAPRPASYALVSNRQSATAFNQPLSFDTSEVTDMNAMFMVRSTQALRPIYTRALPCTLLALQPTHHLPASRPAPRPASYALVSTLGRVRRRSTSR